jgi:hypothetical protein
MSERLQPGDVTEASALLTEECVLMCEGACKTWTPHKYSTTTQRISTAVSTYVGLYFKCCGCARLWGSWNGPLRRRN